MRRGALILGAGCLALGACAPTPPPTGQMPETITNPGREAFAPVSAELPPALPEGTVALEVLSWGTDDTGQTLASTLAALELEPEGEMATTARTLREQGVRLVRLRAPDAGALLELATPVGSVRRRVVQPSQRYERVAEGRPLGEERVVSTELGARRVGPGAPLWSVRAWATVNRTGGFDVRADLIASIGTPSGRERVERLTGNKQSLVEGEPVPALAAHLTIAPGELWALVAAPPDEVWRPINAPAAPIAPIEAPEDPALESATRGPLGPDVEPLRTSGESLFTVAPRIQGMPGTGDLRLVVLLVGRAPERFSLLGAQ